jgi:hypothetical protein
MPRHHFYCGRCIQQLDEIGLCHKCLEHEAHPCIDDIRNSYKEDDIILTPNVAERLATERERQEVIHKFIHR